MIFKKIKQLVNEICDTRINVSAEKENLVAKRKYPFRSRVRSERSKSSKPALVSKRVIVYRKKCPSDSDSSDSDSDSDYVTEESEESEDFEEELELENSEDTEEVESEEVESEESEEVESEEVESEEVEEVEESEEVEEEVEEVEEVEESEEEEEDEDPSEKLSRILFDIVSGKENPVVPKKYNMKKEPEMVQKFVKLLTDPVEENTIDTQICEFKGLTDEKQKELINALENKPIAMDTGVSLMLKILTLKLPAEIKSVIMSRYNSLQNLDQTSSEYYKLRIWLEKVVNIPFGTFKDIPVRLEDGSEKCAEFMTRARAYLDGAVYGQDESKLQILQFITTKIANPDSRGLCLLLIGPAGVGKTSLIKHGIANAVGWPFQFISLGGDSDASTYTGHQMVYESSHCGKIVNSLIASKSMSTVLMFDELDKISQTPKGEEVMNLLIHLTDPVQNEQFQDKYLSGIPIDLSKVMFVFSANDITKIDRVLLDRMLIIDLKGYDLKQKTVIAEQYLLPVALKEVNLTERVLISTEILTMIIEEYAKEDKGVRELKRCIEQITQKINMLRMYNSPDLPFHIKDFCLPFIVKKEHVRLFLKKKENDHGPPFGMYL
jgi:ATP-dependent Lon protease